MKRNNNDSKVSKVSISCLNYSVFYTESSERVNKGGFHMQQLSLKDVVQLNLEQNIVI